MICQEDGGWGQWTSWSLCNQPCRDGVKTRYRSCSNPLPKYGGLQCNGNNTDQKPCYSGECKEVTVNFGMILPDVNYITDYSTPSNIEYKIQTAIQTFYSKLNKNVKLNLTLNFIKNGKD